MNTLVATKIQFNSKLRKIQFNGTLRKTQHEVNFVVNSIRQKKNTYDGNLW